MSLPHDRPTHCRSGPQPGTMALYRAVLDVFGGRGMGVFNCRNVRGGSSLSEHAEGRAIDIGFDATTAAGKQAGDVLVEALIRHADELGIQTIVWDRHSWGYGRTDWSQKRRLTPRANQHTDHVHAGQTWKAARTLTYEKAREILEGDEMSQYADQLARIEQAVVVEAQAGEVLNAGQAALAANATLQSKEAWDVGGRLVNVEAATKRLEKAVSGLQNALDGIQGPGGGLSDEDAQKVARLVLDGLAGRLED